MNRQNARIFLVLLFIFMSLVFVSASEIRVSQLGTQWLVPDEYVDALVNPARINSIEGNVFIGNVYSFLRYGWGSNSTGSNDDFPWVLTPKAAYLGSFGMLNAGIIYSPSGAGRIQNNLYYEFTLDNSLTLMAGMKINENISFGIKPYVNMLFSPFGFTDFFWDGGMGLGINYTAGGMDLGASVYGQTRFSGEKNYIFELSLLGSVKLDGRAQLRFINKTQSNSRQYGLNLFVPDNPFEGLFFGKYNVVNGTGVSYVNDFSGIYYFIELHNDWNIYEYFNLGTVNTEFVTRDERAFRGDKLYLHLGFETKLFVDWLNVRIGYTPASFTYQDRYFLSQNNPSINFARTYNATFSILPPYGVDIGFGINLFENMKLDVSFSDYGLFGHDGRDEYNTAWLSPGYVSNSNMFSVDLEFTMKW